jgi:hypothetical protein
MGDVTMDDATPVTPGSVLAGLEQFTWSNDESRAYEVALEGISMVLGEYTALIAEERSKPAPDSAALAVWEAEQQRWVGRRRSLQVADHAGVAATRDECAAVLERLAGQGHG